MRASVSKGGKEIDQGPRYPRVIVQLSGEGGNAVAIMGRVDQAMFRSGVKLPIRQQFWDEARSGDYDHLLQTVMEWVETE